MHYTVMTTKETHGNLNIELVHNGNQYSVGCYNADTKEYTHKEFDKLENAMAVYLKFVKAIGEGCYDYETRKSWLA